MNLSDYGIVPDHAGREGIPARVTAVHKDRWQLATDRGELYARLKTGEYYHGGGTFPTVGDFVMVQYVENGDSLILATLPRRTVFTRRDPGPIPMEQAVAANFDYVFLMQSMNQNFNPKRLERYLTLAWQSGATPVVLLTKADLAVDHAGFLAQISQAAAGVDIHTVSARMGFGLDALAQYLQPGKTVVFLGSSGVGKSSLVNALAGEQRMAVHAIRESDARGRHTTTHRQLLRLPSGAMVIDTPGMRELGMWDVSEGLGDAFGDVERFLGGCRFSDCRHESEPGCAVKAAIAAGELDADRWERYQKLKAEAVDKAELLRRKRAWSKSVSNDTRNRKKEVW